MNPAETERRARAAFDAMTRAEIIDAILDMKRLGFSDHAVAAACRLSVECVRELIAERRQAKS